MKIHLFILIIIISIIACEKPDPLFYEFQLDKTEITLQVNEESTLTPINFKQIKPEELNIEWHNVDSTVVSIQDGNLKALAAGISVISATINGIESVDCLVKVEGVFDEKNDVYVLGTHGKNLIYWKNGIPTIVKESKNNINAEAMQVVGTNVYIAANEKQKNGPTVAKYFINGEEIVLSEKSSRIYDIAIDGDNIFTVGNIVDESGTNAATLWINGEPTKLDDGGQYSSANAVTISNGDIYVLGFQMVFENGKHLEIAKYWKNGEEFEIVKKPRAFPQDIIVKNNSLYILLSESVNNLILSKYYKDGNGIIVSENNTSTIAKSIAFDGNNLYFSGNVYGEETDNSYATLWTNGIENKLSDYPIYGDSKCKLAISNGDTYVLSNEYIGEIRSPKYYKNGEAVNFIKENGASYVSDIIVVSK